MAKTKNSDRRVVHHVDNLKRLFEVLTNVANGTLVNSVIIRSCSTQTSLAHLSIPHERIFPMSLNTLKSTAKIDPQFSWEALEELRQKVAKLDSSKNIKNRTKSKVSETNDLKNMLDEAYRVRAVLYRAYRHLMSLAESKNHSDEIFAQKLQQHKLMFEAEMGLRVVSRDEYK